MNPIRFNLEQSLSWVGGGGEQYETFRLLPQIRNTASLFISLDETQASINDGLFAVDMSNTGHPLGLGDPNPYYIIDRPAGYHNGHGVFSFADGHVEAHRWHEPTTTTAKARTHVSPKDPDVSWLQEHCTYIK
jgi:prepilin-type processing-associated H-X9-DG protein